MPLRKLAGWLRPAAKQGPAKHGPAKKNNGAGKLAGWVGRQWAHVAYARHVEPTWLELNSHPIPVRDLPEAFHGAKVVQMSDFHGGHQVSSAFLDEAVALAQAQEGDLVVLTGDFIHKGFQHIDRVARILGQLRAPLGVF